MTKSIVLTGAAGGLGQKVSKVLAEQGYHLIITDVFKPTALLEELGDITSDTIAYEIDVTSIGSINQFIKTISKIENIAGLVTLAGITRDRTIKKMTEEEWDSVLDVNLKGTYNMIKAIAPLMKEGGSVVTIGSASAKFGNFGQANYAASKAGVEGITRVAAREFAKNRVRVNCVVPGFIKSPMTDKVPAKRLEIVKKQIPLGRFGQPEDIAYIIEFLLSDKSAYITGASINVNGGLWMG